MNTKQVLANIFQLLAVLVFSSIGFFFVALGVRPHLHAAFSEFILAHPHNLIRLGVAFFACALFFAFGFGFASRGSYYYLSGGVKLTKRLIRKSLKASLFSQFGEKIFLKDIEIHKGKDIELHISLKGVLKEEREEILDQLDLFVTQFLKEKFGYLSTFKVILLTDSI